MTATRRSGRSRSPAPAPDGVEPFRNHRSQPRQAAHLWDPDLPTNPRLEMVGITSNAGSS